MTAHQLLTCKELAQVLRKNVRYVYAMRSRGFLMPGNVATLDAALAFLTHTPHPQARRRSIAVSSGQNES
jgi:hypothetical protein